MENFSLDLPKVEDIKENLEKELKLSDEREIVISDAAREKADQILQVDAYDFSNRQQLIKAIETFGSDLMEQSEEKNAILGKRISELNRMGGESQAVANGLDKLSTEVAELNPSGIDFTKNGFLGIFFNPVKKYFKKYETADVVIGNIIDALEEGSTILKDDNTTLEIETTSMRNISKQLIEKRKLGQELDDYLTMQINNMRAENGDNEKIKFIEEEILFPLRQRMIDFGQKLAVNQQGIIAMETTKRNNYELIRSVERAKFVTVSALRTAVIVAGSLYNQNLVMSKIKLVNDTTNDMIATTSKMLKTQGVEIQKQAIETNIDMDTLKLAITDALEAFESINSYKQKALPQMKQTLAEFDTLVTQGQKIVDGIESSENLRLEMMGDTKGKLTDK
ncbi:toxic anion resistance protein [Enterocloster aldenensis]|nr:toxic anion resistance protein [Enterocloster aldenensis]